MLNQIYHIVFKNPVIDKYGMIKDLENMANILVNSGRLRVDTIDEQNYIRIFIEEISNFIAISPTELNDENIGFTKRIIGAICSRKYNDILSLEKRVNYYIDLAKKEFFKLNYPNSEVVLKLARILVQSAHPIVIKMLLTERTEIFVTYGYTVGDSMDVVTWKIAGDSSGLQSTDGKEAAVFVSCAGDPFSPTVKEHPEYGDGMPAISRMMVIVAQEMGHYSDLKRDDKGRQIGRYSALNFGSSTSKKVSEYRKEDLNNCKKLLDMFLNIPMFVYMQETEKKIKFWDKFIAKKIPNIFLKMHYFIIKKIFLFRMKKKGYDFINIINKKEAYIASYFELCIKDTMVNLEPKSDAYKRENPDEQEAMYCVEALARVPQQVIKLGKNMTKILMPNLYKLYYFEVIPGNIRAWESINNIKYNFDRTIIKPNFIYKIKTFAKKLFSKS